LTPYLVKSFFAGKTSPINPCAPLTSPFFIQPELHKGCQDSPYIA
jgi:hypothetical protein